LTFTLDPLPATLKTSADHAHGVGLLASANLNGIYDLRLLNQLLAAHNEPQVQGL
jgi:NitT/TauT family transport system substrate-binding protein